MDTLGKEAVYRFWCKICRVALVLNGLRAVVLSSDKDALTINNNIPLTTILAKKFVFLWKRLQNQLVARLALRSSTAAMAEYARA